ncbi:MAG: nucleotidyltransferase domain-containing protein [Chloroflexota bacterium]
MSEHAPSLTKLREQRDEILSLAKEYNVSNIRVVGSVARQQASIGSDVDLLITMPAERDVFDLIGLWLDLETLLEYRGNLIPDNSSHQTFIETALEDAVRL